ncbi:MAG TPA: RNA 2',3'-cyclic phosphodiesterase [Gaiellales bacterium]
MAVTPPEAVRAQLHAYATSLAHPSLRVVPAETLHVTVLFLGSVGLDAIDELAGLLAGVAAREPPLALTVRHAAPGPPRRPSMLWGEVTGGEPLLRLSLAMHAVSARLAPHLARPLRDPHVTLARGRRPLRGVERAAIGLDPDVFQVGEARLIRSRLSPRGARYETVAALPLDVTER